MNTSVQTIIAGRTAVKIAETIERAIRAGQLAPGDPLPTVRALAAARRVSPATVASAYRLLQARALLVAHGRRGTRVGPRPLAGAQRRHIVPPGAVDLSDGNPDPALLPAFDRILRDLDYGPHLYGGNTLHAGLIAQMGREMEADGIRVGPFCVVQGAMDGIDRLLSEHLRPGDRVAVEDPGFTGHHDLVASRGLSLAPVRIDTEGMRPDALDGVCREGVQAVLITPRAQSPAGAMLSPQRAGELRRVLRRWPEVLVIEDDHASFLCAGPFQRVHEPEGRWAHIRSFSKAFNPDMRLAVMTGDERTLTRLLDRLVVIERWTSFLLQTAAHRLLTDADVRNRVTLAGRIYDERREALLAALRRRGFDPQGVSGYNIWLPVGEETSTVQGLAAAGWAVAAGERFRLASPAGIRITAARLTPSDAERFASSLAAVLAPPRRSPTV